MAAELPSPDAPLRLRDAARIAFPPDQVTGRPTMTESGLRREAAAGRLTIWRVAGKDFTSLAAIREMLEKCRVETQSPVSGSERSCVQTRAASRPLSGSSATLDAGTKQLALAAAMAAADRLSKSSRTRN